MAKEKERIRRLLRAFPRVYAVEEQGSALGALLAALGHQLDGLDQTLNRILRNRFLSMAGGEPLLEGTASPLEMLGALLGVERQPHEPAEVYRNRIQLYGKSLRLGVSTPTGLFQLATADLGGYPCRLTRRDQDTLFGWGMALEKKERCQNCSLKSLEDCPIPGFRLFQVLVTDYPQLDHHYTAQALAPRLSLAPRAAPPPGYDTLGHFTLNNVSLFPDRPWIKITATQETRFPALSSLETEEMLFYAGTLRAGESLTLFPHLSSQELAPFESALRSSHHPWLAAMAQGSALVDGPFGVREIGSQIFYARGFGFDEARFAPPSGFAAVPVFAALENRLLTPLLPHGRQTWVYGCLNRREALANWPNGQDGPPPPEWLINGPAEAQGGPAHISLHWLARPPASFKVSVERTEAVSQAEAWGGSALLYQTIHHVRAAGVFPRLDFPLPVFRQALQMKETSFQIQAKQVYQSQMALGDQPEPVTNGAWTLSEPAQPQEVGAFYGRLEVTHWDWSALAPGHGNRLEKLEALSLSETMGWEGRLELTPMDWSYLEFGHSGRLEKLEAHHLTATLGFPFALEQTRWDGSAIQAGGDNLLQKTEIHPLAERLYFGCRLEASAFDDTVLAAGNGNLLRKSEALALSETLYMTALLDTARFGQTLLAP